MPPFGSIPWLFLLPPVLIGAIGLFVWWFGHTEAGKARKRFVQHKYGIVTGDAAPKAQEPSDAAKDENAPEAAAKAKTGSSKGKNPSDEQKPAQEES
ncbi:MAG: hypothetical protein KC561_06800 [Myxococcales bacterium]|nr:hypothetical protein [Myxococcales bacterium]